MEDAVRGDLTRFQEAWTQRQVIDGTVCRAEKPSAGEHRCCERWMKYSPTSSQTVAIVSRAGAGIIRVHLEQAAMESVWDRIPPNAEPERVQVRMP
jgi:hypothetical protein